MVDKLRDGFERDSVRRDNPFDTPTGYSGQEYSREREAAELRRDPPGGKRPTDDVTFAAEGNDPPETGRRAFFDPATGEVHGSGSGAGGGNAGEDFASDAAAGSGYPRTFSDDEAAAVKPDSD